MICHPDKVAAELEDIAQTLFIDLNKAYQANDLNRVKEICEQLKTGIQFVNKSVEVTEILKLKRVVLTLREKHQEWLKQLSDLKSSNTYIEISNIEDWDTYFKIKLEYLKEELQTLEKYSS